jgi:pilus assembly protein CpaB
MKFKSVVLLAVAIGCGLVAMLGVQQVMSGDKSAETKMIKALVAIEEIAPGLPLDETNVAFKELPEDLVPSGAVTKKEQFEERALKRGAFPGDVITKAKLDENLIASYEIPEGMRVVTVSVNLTKTHSGLMA